ncbi:MAG: ABC transporter permease, partial [Terriglobales bacterium]
MTESVALALFGGALGLALAPLASRGLTALLAHGGWRAAAPTLDWRVLAFTFAVSLATGLVFGLAPALRCTRLRLDQAVKHGAMPAAGRLHTDKILAVAQTALSLLLLVGAGLLVRTLVNLERQPLGFDPAQVLTFSLDARQAGYAEPALAGFYLGLQARLASLPGVAAAGVSQHSLLGGDMGGDAVRVPSSASPLQWRSSMSNGVGPGFFAALRIPILRGRAIDAEDVQAAKPVAVISTAMARAYFGAADPVGRLVLRRDSISASTAFTVVG